MGITNRLQPLSVTYVENPLLDAYFVATVLHAKIVSLVFIWRLQHSNVKLAQRQWLAVKYVHPTMCVWTVKSGII